MCFKKLTIKKVLTCTLLIFFLGIFSLALLPASTLAGNGSIDPPPPDSNSNPDYTSAGTPSTDLSTWDIIVITTSTIL